MSGMIEGLAACFAGLADPREACRCAHGLIDVLVIAVCAVIACAESWEDIQGSRMKSVRQPRCSQRRVLASRRVIFSKLLATTYRLTNICEFNLPGNFIPPCCFSERRDLLALN